MGTETGAGPGALSRGCQECLTSHETYNIFPRQKAPASLDLSVRLSLDLPCHRYRLVCSKRVLGFFLTIHPHPSNRRLSGLVDPHHSQAFLGSIARVFSAFRDLLQGHNWCRSARAFDDGSRIPGEKYVFPPLFCLPGSSARLRLYRPAHRLETSYSSVSIALCAAHCDHRFRASSDGNCGQHHLLPGTYA